MVIESYLSDKSYNETLDYPTDGRFFTVRLTLTGDVTNEQSKAVSHAVVELHSDQDEIWEYLESPMQPGVYALLDNEFKARPGVKYKLRIQLSSEERYESEWEALPSNAAPAMGNVEFKEIVFQKYAIQANEKVVVSVKGVSVEINVPENRTGSSVYYKWNFVPHWIYIAPLSSVIHPGHICWATTPNYLRNFAIQQDNVGGYKKRLFQMETIRNERIFEMFSALIIQQAMTEQYFNFWKEMREQNQEDAISDRPLFNLQTNFHSLDGEKKVSGYFGVVNEQAIRWYFSAKDLTYFVPNTLKPDCEVDYGGAPAPECFDCRQYSKAEATNVKPSWWTE